MSINQDPSHYSPSIHAVQKKRERDISWEYVAETIESGEAHATPAQDRVLFVKEFEDTESPVGVVVLPDMGEIVTVEWRTKEVSHTKI